MEQSEEELKKKADEFLAKIKKNSSDQDKGKYNRYSESQKKEFNENFKWRMRMDYESGKRSEEIRQMFQNPTQHTPKSKDKKPIDWGNYLLMGFLGVIALFFFAYGIIFMCVFGLILIVQHFLGNKRY